MRRTFGRERAAHDQPRSAHLEIFLVLCKLARWLDRPWVIVTQKKLQALVLARFGRKLSIRTLNRHLLALERHQVIARTVRHIKDKRTGEPVYRATLYTFGLAAPLWIKNVRDAAAIPFGRLRVPKMAISREPLSNQNCPLCGSLIHTRAKGRSRPPQAGAGDGPRKARRARSTIPA